MSRAPKKRGNVDELMSGFTLVRGGGFEPCAIGFIDFGVQSVPGGLLAPLLLSQLSVSGEAGFPHLSSFPLPAFCVSLFPLILSGRTFRLFFQHLKTSLLPPFLLC